MAVPDYGPNVDSHWINKINRKYINYNENFDEVKPKKKFDEIYEENEIQKKNLDIHRSNVLKMKREMRNFDESDLEVKNRVKREENDPRCESFEFDANDKFITHPHPRNGGNNYYYNNSNCVTKITGE